MYGYLPFIWFSLRPKAFKFSIWISSSSIHDFCPFVLKHNWQMVWIDKAFAFLRVLFFHEILFKRGLLLRRILVKYIRLLLSQSFDTALKKFLVWRFIWLLHIVLNDVFTDSVVSQEEYYSLSKELFFLNDIIPFFFYLLHFLEDLDAFKGAYSYNMLFEAHKATTNSQHHLICPD